MNSCKDTGRYNPDEFTQLVLDSCQRRQPTSLSWLSRLSRSCRHCDVQNYGNQMPVQRPLLEMEEAVFGSFRGATHLLDLSVVAVHFAETPTSHS